jgi:hypothetical protein
MDKLKNLESLLKSLEFNLHAQIEIDVDIITKVGSLVLLLIIFPSPLQNFVE